MTIKVTLGSFIAPGIRGTTLTIDEGRGIVVLGYKLPSRANARMHWRALAKLTKEQRMLGRVLAAKLKHAVPSPTSIECVRISPRLLDCDNLASAFKAVRDGIAVEYGVSDAPTGPIVWTYSQAKGEAAIEVRAR